MTLDFGKCHNVLSLVCTVALSMLLTQGCANHAKRTSSQTLAASAADLQSNAESALSSSCGSCHGPNSSGQGGMNYITDLPKLVESGMVNRGTAADHESSLIWKRITSTTAAMPPPVPPMSDADKTAVQDWITADAPLTGTLADAAKAAIVTNCGLCHGPGSSGDGGITYIDDLAKLVEMNKVKRGDEAAHKKSRVLVRILHPTRPMPPVVAPMADEDKEAIRAWIFNNSPIGG
jgi:cytochrome c553